VKTQPPKWNNFTYNKTKKGVAIYPRITYKIYIETLIEGLIKMTLKETYTKKSLFLSQAQSFNFELNEDQLLAKALEAGFVVKIGEDLYEVNVNYGE